MFFDTDKVSKQAGLLFDFESNICQCSAQRLRPYSQILDQAEETFSIVRNKEKHFIELAFNQCFHELV